MQSCDRRRSPLESRHRVASLSYIRYQTSLAHLASKIDKVGLLQNAYGLGAASSKIGKSWLSRLLQGSQPPQMEYFGCNQEPSCPQACAALDSFVASWRRLKHNDRKDKDDRIEAWCSFCAKHCTHTNESIWAPLYRDKYKCTNCGGKTLVCQNIDRCHGMTQGSLLWDDELCRHCDTGAIWDWHQTSTFDPLLRKLADELRAVSGDLYQATWALQAHAKATKLQMQQLEAAISREDHMYKELIDARRSISAA
jgi:hypothetical protein